MMLTLSNVLGLIPITEFDGLMNTSGSTRRYSRAEATCKSCRVSILAR